MIYITKRRLKCLICVTQVLKKIISEAVELEFLKKAEGLPQFFKINELLPFDGSGWGVTYWNKNKIQDYINLRTVKKMVGLFTWYRNGKKDSRCYFDYDKPDGLMTKWYEWTEGEGSKLEGRERRWAHD